VNTRWHYSANGTSGSWSATNEVKCQTKFETSQQAMEGNLLLKPGTEIKAGYDFTLPGIHTGETWTVIFIEGLITFHEVHCVSKKAPTATTFSITLPTQSYVVTNTEWYPSGDQSSPLVYQGKIAAPDLCAGGELRLDKGAKWSGLMTLHFE
jgi:hypothetical protein